MAQISTYCCGAGCALKTYCERYVLGLYLDRNETDIFWMDDCGMERTAYTAIES